MGKFEPNPKYCGKFYKRFIKTWDDMFCKPCACPKAMIKCEFDVH
jgi:hypothetical protein